MIEGGWGYVVAAYAITLIAFLALAAVVALRAMHWASRARALERDQHDR